MKPVCDKTVKSLLVDMKSRLIEEKEYDYEAKEMCHKIDRILAGKTPQKNSGELKSIMVHTLR